MDYLDMNGPGGQALNIGGTEQFLSYAPLVDFLTLEESDPIETALSDAALIEISVDHVFNTGKNFIKIYTTEDKGEYDFNGQGEMDGNTLKPVLKFFYPGAETAAFAFAAKSQNQKFIWMVPLGDGTVVQLGTAQFPASVKCQWKSATNSSGVRGMEVEVTCAVAKVINKYTGVISYTPAV